MADDPVDPIAEPARPAAPGPGTAAPGRGQPPRAFAVVNPAAGSGGTRRRWPGLRDELRRAGFELESAETTAPGAATVLARQAAHAGWPLVIAVGGDGTVNETINGLVDATGRAGAALAVVPTGRGRDVCRNLAMPMRLEGEAHRLATAGEIAVDLLRVEWPGGRHRYAVNAAGAGFDAEVAGRARAGAGALSYLLATLAALGRHAPRPATVELDGAVVSSRRVTAVVVANGEHYGGGMRIAPGASPLDGRLDLVVLGDIGRAELLRWLPAVYSGRHLEHPRVMARTGATVAIAAPGPLPVHLDGEPDQPAPVRVSVCPGALRLRRVARPGRS